MLMAFFIVFVMLWTLCYAVLPSPLPITTFESEEQLLSAYVSEGYTYDKIIAFLSAYHAIDWSTRKFKQKLKDYNLYRRKNKTPMQTVEEKILEELNGPNSNVGYRQMWKILSSVHHLIVSRNDVMKTMQRLNPDGCQRRRQHCLRRRVYRTEGPNRIWHIDGFDKLKPYGFPIHGAIDGFSRRVLWIEVGSSNNDPSVVGRFFLDCVRQIGGCPEKLCTDAGSENGTIATIQTMFTNNPYSHSFVTSVRNQRIEAWWSYFKKYKGQWWMDFFRDVCDSEIYNPANKFQRSCFQFCFMDYIQHDLNQMATRWNAHRIRPSTGSCPPGVPNELYFIPQTVNSVDYKIPIRNQQIEDLRFHTKEKTICEDGNVFEYLSFLKQQLNLDMPSNPEDALQNFITLMRLSGEV